MCGHMYTCALVYMYTAVVLQVYIHVHLHVCVVCVHTGPGTCEKIIIYLFNFQD